MCRIGVMSGGKWCTVAKGIGFVGEYIHSVDAKGRMALPSKFREQLGFGFVIARGLDRCLFVYPDEEWSLIIEKFKEMPMNQKDTRDYARYFLSGANEAVPDKQGRIVLPLPLRDYAKITKEVCVLGVGSRVEIWDKEAWDAMKLRLEEEFPKLAESVAGI